MLPLWGNHSANYRGCLKWKEAKTAPVKRGQPERRSTNGAETSEGGAIGGTGEPRSLARTTLFKGVAV
jgi:hypothetical protein